MSKHNHDHEDCSYLLGSLSEYVDGALGEQLCKEIERHVADCEDCRVVIDTLEKTVYLYHATAKPKAGAEVAAKDCDNPIEEHMQVSRSLGVRGTPAIILQDGSMLPGYVPADKLIAQLASLNLSTAKSDEPSVQ